MYSTLRNIFLWFRDREKFLYNVVNAAKIWEAGSSVRAARRSLKGWVRIKSSWNSGGGHDANEQIWPAVVGKMLPNDRFMQKTGYIERNTLILEPASASWRGAHMLGVASTPSFLSYT